MKTTEIPKRKTGRKPLPDDEKSVKRSLSFPPAMWQWIEKRSGETGVPSRIVQKAVRLMQEAEEIQAAAECQPINKSGCCE